jgi:phosphatidylinositol glycan class B
VLVVAAGPRLWAALEDGGVFWPDELSQTLEPAHRFAFGWGLMTREFREGSRSWLFPGLIGLVWKGAARVGVHSGETLVSLAKVGMAVVSLAGVWFAMALARRLRGERAAILAGLLLAACPPLVVLGSRCVPECASATLIVLAALLLVRRGPRDAWKAGALAALSIFLSYPTGLLALGFLLLLLAQQRREEARAYLAAASGTALLGGLLDWPTLGWPFHSFYVFVRANVFEGRMGDAGDTPALFYWQHLASSIGLTYGLLLLGLVFGWRRAAGLVSIVVGYVLVHSCVHQKELRIILPVLPLGVAVAAVGLSRLMDGLGARGRPTYILGIACAAAMAWVVRAPTRGEMGFGASDWVIWHSGADYFRTIDAASAAPDLCGAIFVDNEPQWTGGYTYLNRPVPIYFDLKPAHLAAANYIVAAKTTRAPRGWRSVYTDGGDVLFRREGSCAPPPRDWTMNLP